ncbi:2,3-diaminopropionate biosynthesis protein SbnB [Paenibacillus lentus]|uniref:2,3-diaminopropionate biosynthesis protein SbnB n=1 Tax=Paenibacillus lentus TaxID=1338368 RepID=A0A3Q8S6T7_9BACL|nr:2,3-diaminopropionate biosynthesis protein SbnB [Paenibacillus lentus]AZK48677.1 2,3-diaminopropionate biosynthesis protein SbnB [Paenibacillus lentus]
MLYLNNNHLQTIGLRWEELENCIVETLRLLDSGDYAQPIKPYLRYVNPANRIIAMPAYVGGTVQAAGLKWIASFPDNTLSGLPRAHSVLLLNKPNTGVPYAIINSPLPSVARTVAVSAVMLRHYLQLHPAAKRIRIGIIGFGPIGQHHYDMCGKLFGECTDEVLIYDIRGAKLETPVIEDADASYRSRTRIVDSWQELYNTCNVIITCTVSDHRYIDQPPLAGSLLLHVSLRDYKASALEQIQTTVVDDWDEVCRENTDIELLHVERGLTKENTCSLTDVVCQGALGNLAADESVLFCPMGMAVFDITTAAYWVEKAQSLGIGMDLTNI